MSNIKMSKLQFMLSDVLSPEYEIEDKQARADIDDLKQQIENGIGIVIEETDPTVPAWAKEPNKPTYTADEVGALSDTTVIPSKVSELENDEKYVTDDELNAKGYATSIEVEQLSEQIDNILFPVIHATKYGVLPSNDGLTNTTNLQNLIDTINENGGGTIYIPAGTYTFASSGDDHVTANHCIRMKSNVHIYGDGANTILKPSGHSVNGLDMFFFNDYIEKNAANYLENCSFKNFVIDGIDTTIDNYTSSGKGFMFNLFKNCYWKNVSVINTVATGFGVDCPINSAMVDCYAENCGKGTTFAGAGASGFGIGYGYSDKENFFMSNCISKSNTRYGVFFEHQMIFNSDKYTAVNNCGFIISECKAENNYCNFGGVRGINVQFKNCFSKLAKRHGYIFENSDNCHALGCYSNTETDTSFVILSSGDNKANYEVKDVSFNQCISKYSKYGVKVTQYDTTARVTRNMIKDCFFDLPVENTIITSGIMENLILFGNVSTGTEKTGTPNNDFSATITDFVNENNSWNDNNVVSVSGELPYAGQKLIAFGTSTVSRCDQVWENNQLFDKYNGGYLAYLVKNCGFDSYTNEGVAGIPSMHMGNGSGGYTNGISDNVKDKLTSIENHDVIQIHCAGNDYLLEAPLGCVDTIITDDDGNDAGGSNHTFAGALKRMLKDLQELQATQVAKGKKPIEIFVTVPTKSKRNNSMMGDDEEGKYHEDYVNIVGHKEIDYVDMCIKICNKYGVHVVDTYRNSGISPLNASVYLEDDGSHLNSKGYEVFGQTIAGVMKSHHGAVLNYEDDIKEVEDTVMIDGERYDVSNSTGFEYKMILNLDGTPYLYSSHAPMYFHDVGNGKYVEAFVMYYTTRAKKNTDSNSFEKLKTLTTTTQNPIHLQTLRLNTTGYYAWPGATRNLDGLILAANHDIKLWGSDEVLFYKKWDVNEESSTCEVVEDNSAYLIIRVEGSPYEEFTLDQCTILNGDTNNILESWKSGNTIRAELHFYSNSNNYFGEAVVVPAEVTAYDEWVHLYYKTLKVNNYHKYHNNYNGRITLRNNAITDVYFQPEYDLIISVKNHGDSKLTSDNVSIIEGNIISLAQKVKSGQSLKVQVRLYKADSDYYNVECSVVEGRAVLYSEWLNVYFTIPAHNSLFTATLYWNYVTGALDGSNLYKCVGTEVN